MKYNSLSTIKVKYPSSLGEFFKQLLRSNIKMPFFNSSKRINFSERQYNGERFLLNNRYFFPFNYVVYDESGLNQPLNIALKLENNFKELELCQKDDFDKRQYEAAVKESIESNISKLDKIMKYEKKIDFPVSIFAIYCYSKAILNELGLSKNLVQEETFNKSLDHFFEKIQYSDGTYLSLIMCSLVKNNIWDNKKWNMIFKRLNDVKFEFEFTKVESINPHLFQYRNVNEKKDINDPLDNYGDGYYALCSLKEALKNNVEGSKNALEEFSKRVKA